MGRSERLKDDLQDYLQTGRDVLLWKLDGLSAYDSRRPLVRSGTNVLGVVKHVATVEAGYLGQVFGRPFPERIPWMDNYQPGDDMWATLAESSDQIASFYRRVWLHSDATIADIDLETVGQVPWWPPESREVTLHRVLIHVIAETHRHAGHTDILREMIDGAIGYRRDRPSVGDVDDQWWIEYRAKLEQVARQAAGS
jgi:uncharacterized damage-inducible protein DinB